MLPSSKTFASPNDEHVESYRTNNSQGNLPVVLSSRRPEPPGASCSLWGIRDPPPNPHQPDDLKPRVGKMQDPPSLQQKYVDSGSIAEADCEECLGQDYSDTNANGENEDKEYCTQIGDDEEEQGEEMDDMELDDEGLELWLSNTSPLSSLSGASPMTLSPSASFNCSLDHFAKSSWSDSRRTSIDSDDKPLTFRLHVFMMIGDDLELVHRLNMEKIKEQRLGVTAAADSSTAAARVIDGELILGDSRGHCEFTKSESPSLTPRITPTIPASSTTAGTQSLVEAASMLPRLPFPGRRLPTTSTTATTESW